MNASLRNQVSGILPLRAPLRCAHRRHAPRALFISKASVVRLVVLVVGSDGAGQPVVIVVDASIIATIVPHAGAMVVRGCPIDFHRGQPILGTARRLYAPKLGHRCAIDFHRGR